MHKQYEPPTLDRIGSLAQLTRQRPNPDVPPGKTQDGPDVIGLRGGGVQGS